MRSACALALLCALVSPARTEPGLTTLHYAVEWRLIRAGSAKLAFPDAGAGAAIAGAASLEVQSTGLVSKLYKVDDKYSTSFDQGFCSSAVTMDAAEGKRRRETKVSFDRARGKAGYLERDLLKNAVVKVDEIDVPPCVHDIVSGLLALRQAKLEMGQSAALPVSDGKKAASVRIEAQAREDIKTPAGAFKTVRYEVFLFGGVLYQRQARAFVWLTDDARKLPVQLRVKLQLAIGTITLQLEKEDRA